MKFFIQYGYTTEGCPPGCGRTIPVSLEVWIDLVRKYQKGALPDKLWVEKRNFHPIR